jgi:hypothetical protein
MRILIEINDGFTLRGKIEAMPGLYDEVRFDYRPALPERVMTYLKADKSTPAKDLQATLSLLAEHLKGWSLDAPLDEATLRRVPYPALQTLLNHVTGYSATDWGEKEKN